MVSLFGSLVSMIVGLLFTITGNKYRPACDAVKAAISDASDVYYPGDPSYVKGSHHYFASSNENPACVVEPGTPEDVGKILNVIEATRTPFAVMSGGHTVNPGFSSTRGIHIYTGRFSQVTYDAASNTAVIGSGLIWDTVYEKLQNYNVTVVGGRVPGVGVGGLVLGGGYSYKTNQYGLAIDTVVGFNLVLPDGTVTYVTQATHPDLFFGLKGGFNNFGVVTDFTMKTFPQTEVWGGQIVYSPAQFEQVRAAIADFSIHSQDPKAVVLPLYTGVGKTQAIVGTVFYDGPTPPPGIFDKFTNIPSISSDLKTRSYLNMILSLSMDSYADTWISIQSLGVKHFTEPFLAAIESELAFWSAELTPKGATSLVYVVEPFLQNYLSHANSPSAFPDPAAREPGNAPAPIHIVFSWNNPIHGGSFVAAAESTARHLSDIAQAEGLLTQPLALYGNDVGFNTPLVDIYGGNLPALQALKAKIDPKNIMDLAGGFKFSSEVPLDTRRKTEL